MDRIRENPAELFRIVNIAAGAFIVLGGIGNLIKHSFSSIILGIYLILSGVVVGGLEIRTPTEEQKTLVHKYASFLHSWLGRGVFYVLVAVLMLNYYILLYISGSVVGIIGLAYIALHFIPAFDPPSTMQPPSVLDEESAAVWQAQEQ